MNDFMFYLSVFSVFIIFHLHVKTTQLSMVVTHLVTKVICGVVYVLKCVEVCCECVCMDQKGSSMHIHGICQSSQEGDRLSSTLLARPTNTIPAQKVGVKFHLLHINTYHQCQLDKS